MDPLFEHNITMQSSQGGQPLQVWLTLQDEMGQRTAIMHNKQKKEENKEKFTSVGQPTRLIICEMQLQLQDIICHKATQEMALSCQRNASTAA